MRPIVEPVPAARLAAADRGRRFGRRRHCLQDRVELLVLERLIESRLVYP